MQATAIGNLAQRLLMQEVEASQDSINPREVAERLLEMLLAHLSNYIGPEGVKSLLGRAEALTGPSGDADERSVALLLNFLELLVTFIGEGLTLRIMKASWPQAAIDDADTEDREST